MFRPVLLEPFIEMLPVPKTSIASRTRKMLSHLPLSVAKPLSCTPFFIQKKMMHQALSRLFTEAINDGEVDFLEGHWLKIEVSDLQMSWYFSRGAQREILIAPSGHSDVCIRGNLACFIKLAAQKEDPDTLFFQRALAIEGDTDLGLEVKNLLDRLELDSLPPEARFALVSAAEFVSVFEINDQSSQS